MEVFFQSPYLKKYVDGMGTLRRRHQKDALELENRNFGTKRGYENFLGQFKILDLQIKIKSHFLKVILAVNW